jgi:DNA-directed RNA polymerase subunit M/transcription elongation factor TFIIS
MALPKVDVPIHEVTLISTGKKIKYRPFLVKEQKLFLMAAESKDPKEMINTVKQVLNNCILSENVNVDELPSFDLENIFLNLRARSVGEIIDLKYNCNNVVKSDKGEDKVCNGMVKFDLNILEIEHTKNDKHDKKIEISSSIGIVMKYPNMKMFSNLGFKNTESVEVIMELIVDCIDYIYDVDKIYYAKDSTKEELMDFVDNLHQEDLIKIQNFFNTMPKISKTLNFKCGKCGHEEEIVVEGIQNFFV